MDRLQKEIVDYWTKRSLSYGEQHAEELKTKERWEEFLFPKLSMTDKKILDVGTGPGFMSILLAEAGYEVTAVDFTEKMLEEAKRNAGAYEKKIQWMKMDAQQLEFEDETFDTVITRNVTWNLEEPFTAYQEWYRVLKDDGLLINIDANWYRYLYDDQVRKKYNEDRQLTKKYQIKDYYEKTDIVTMERIAKEIPLSKRMRPAWDDKVLKEIGFKEVTILEDINPIVLDRVEQINFAFSPLFFIQAVK